IVAERQRDDRSRPVSVHRDPGTHGAKQSERLEVDADQLDPREPAGLDVVVDRLLVRGREYDTACNAAVVVRGLADDVEVEDGLVDRNRQCLVGTEANGVPELALIVDSLDVESTDADTVRPDPEPDVAAGQLVIREEPVQRVAEGLDVADLSRDDDPGGEWCTGKLHEPRSVVVDHPRRRDLRGADLQSDQFLLLRLLRLLLRRLGRARALLLLRTLEQVRELDLLVQVDHRLGPTRKPQAARRSRLVRERGRNRSRRALGPAGALEQPDQLVGPRGP